VAATRRQARTCAFRPGTAFDLTAERVQTDYTTTRVAPRTIANAAYRVTISQRQGLGRNG
jgi:hypothetical protein